MPYDILAGPVQPRDTEQKVIVCLRIHTVCLLLSFSVVVY